MSDPQRELSPLTDLQVVLHQSGMSTEFMPPKPGEAEQLLVVIAEAAGHPLIARLVWLEELNARIAEAAGQPESQRPLVWQLEILVALPVTADVQQANDLNLLAFWQAAELPLGTYGVDPDGQLLFKHTLLCSSPYDQATLFLKTVELIRPALVSHVPAFLNLVDQKRTADSQWEASHG